MSDVATVGMIGLPGAGKTTYAVVFYVCCEAGKDGMSITQYGIGDRVYLNEQAALLARCESVERTSQQSRDELRLRMKLSTDGPERELLMPDMSGEFLEASMSTRVLDVRLASLLAESSALLLFVRSDELLAAETLQDFNELLAATGERVDEGDVAPEREDWDVGLACTQARLTDIVQELLEHRREGPTRVCLVLSAWDARPDATLAPRDWAAKHLPLLVAALTNQPLLEWEVFGVSAQGGSFYGSERGHLCDQDVADRPRVEQRDGEPTGIGAPLEWALESP